MTATVLLAFFSGCLALRPAVVLGQLAPTPQRTLSPTITVPDTADTNTRRYLDQVAAYRESQQWGEAIERLQQISRQFGDRVVAVAPPSSDADVGALDQESQQAEGDQRGAFSWKRYVGVKHYCQQQFATLPEAGLKLYRQRVDAQARRFYETARANRDPQLLRRLIDQSFASSWTDDALLLLGDLLIQQGKFAQARSAWTRILPVEFLVHAQHDAAQPGHGGAQGAGQGNGSARRVGGDRTNANPQATSRGPSPPLLLHYPDTNLDFAAVCARLVLVSILEGHVQRAETELERGLFAGPGFAKRFPRATGRLLGQQGKYVDLLRQLLAESRQWPPIAPSADWKTFAGSPRRSGATPEALAIAGRAWDEAIALQRVAVQPAAISPIYSNNRYYFGEESTRPLSYFPLLVGDLLLVHHRPLVGGTNPPRCKDRILAFNVHTGQPYWPIPPEELPAGGLPEGVHPAEIYSSAKASLFSAYPSLGIPRYTLTVDGNKLLARVGEPVTNWGTRRQRPNFDQSTIVCLDLAAQGAVLWTVSPDGPEWTFDGVPVCQGSRCYVAMKQSGSRPQAHVACFDLETGRLLWRQFVCSAETRTIAGEVGITHSLLAAAGETVYWNSNMGAVAALDAETGRLHWLTVYPRRELLDLNKPKGFYYRDLNPCVCAGGLVFVAPADTPDLLALQAETGKVLWSLQMPDVTHLLGVAGNRLVASGRRLHWVTFDPSRPTQPGRIQTTSSGHGSEIGYGRGQLVGRVLYWPTRDQVQIYDSSTGVRVSNIDLRRDLGLGERPGNLLVAGGYLIVAGPDRLMALSQYSSRKRKEIQGFTIQEPDQPVNWYRLARCEQEMQMYRQATAHYRECLSRLKATGDTSAVFVDDQPLGVLAERGLYESLLRSAQPNVQAGQDSPVDFQGLRDAAQAAPSPAGQLRALLLLAEGYRLLGQTDEALKIWEGILASDTLADLSLAQFLKADFVAADLTETEPTSDAAGLSSGWGEAIVPVRHRVSDLHRQALARLNQSGNSAGVALCWQRASQAWKRVDQPIPVEVAARLTRTYPDAPATTRGLLAAAGHLLAQRRPAAAVRLASQLQQQTGSGLLERPATDRLSALAVIGLGQEALGFLSLAADTWQRLAESGLTQSEVFWPVAGSPLPAGASLGGWAEARSQALRQRLQHQQSKHLRRCLWSAQQLPRGPNLRSAIEPTGRPPSRDSACLLSSETPVEAINLATGKRLWKYSLASPLLWAAYHQQTVVLVCREEVVAVDLVDGSRWWRTRIADPRPCATPFALMETTPQFLLLDFQGLSSRTNQPLAADAAIQRLRSNGILSAALTQAGQLILQRERGDALLLTADGRPASRRPATSGVFTSGLSQTSLRQFPFSDELLAALPAEPHEVMMPRAALETPGLGSQGRAVWDQSHQLRFFGFSAKKKPGARGHLGSSQRSVFIQGDALLLALGDRGVIRLDVKTGKPLWDAPAVWPLARNVSAKKPPAQDSPADSTSVTKATAVISTRQSSLAAASFSEGLHQPESPGCHFQVLGDERFLWCVADGLVRAFWLSDGQSAWKKAALVGRASQRWRLARVGPWLLAYPSLWRRGDRLEVILLDPESGQRVQELQLAPERTDVEQRPQRTHQGPVEATLVEQVDFYPPCFLRSSGGGLWRFRPSPELFGQSLATSDQVAHDQTVNNRPVNNRPAAEQAGQKP